MTFQISELFPNNKHPLVMGLSAFCYTALHKNCAAYNRKLAWSVSTDVNGNELKHD